MKGIIYRTICLITYDKYIGQHYCQTTDFDGYLGSGVILQNAIKKYGKENFIRQTIRIVEDDEDMDDLEIYYIKINNAVERKDYYNIACGGDSVMFGRKHSEETKQKMREKATGRNVSEDTKQKIREKAIGREVSEETRQRLSKKATGRKASEETKQKIREKSIGRKVSEKALQKLAERLKNNNPNNYPSVKEKQRSRMSGDRNIAKREDVRNKISKSSTDYVGIVLINTGEIFFNASEAASKYKECGVFGSNIIKCCDPNHYSKSAGKLNGEKMLWRFATQEEIETLKEVI